MTTPRNPPAFPQSDDQRELLEEAREGMSLRDWFAGQALSALSTTMSDPEPMARRAYAIADAMLIERQNG